MRARNAFVWRVSADSHITLARIGRVVGLSASALSRRLSGAKKKKEPAPKAKVKPSVEARRKKVKGALASLHVKVASEVQKKLKPKCHVRTIRRDLTAMACRFLPMPRGPLVMEGDEAARTKWCKEQMKKEDYARTSIFCDKKLFSMSQKGIRSWVLPGQGRRHRRVPRGRSWGQLTVAATKTIARQRIQTRRAAASA